MSLDKFKLNGELVIVTGGAGLLGLEYCKAIQEIGGTPVALDIKPLDEVRKLYGKLIYLHCDITDLVQVNAVLSALQQSFPDKPIYGLVNNAALDPKVQGSQLSSQGNRLETVSLDTWNKELSVGLTGAFLCTQVFGAEMIKNKRGVIINVSSVLGLLAPNQTFYEQFNTTKPVGYTVVKHAIVGLTKHTATEWAKYGVRCNCIAPAGVFNGHSDEFTGALAKRIPLGRMADKKEYNSIVQFLLTDASSYMTGSVVSIDGGFTAC